MNEAQIKYIIEKHIENLFHEIWRPIHDDLKISINDIGLELIKINKQIKALKKKASNTTEPPVVPVISEQHQEILNDSMRINKQTEGLHHRIRFIENNIKNEVYNVMNNNQSEISNYLNNLAKCALDKYFKDFEYKCVTYMKAVDEKMKSITQ